MENFTPPAPAPADAPTIHTVLVILEQQLAALDRLGAHIAAAHCDAAIQQLRLDQSRKANDISSAI